MERLRLATTWFGGCSGCHMSFLDLDELLIDLAAKIDLVYSPLVDAKQYPPKVDVCLVEGAVCNADHVEMAHTIRRQTRIVVAFGDCAVTTNVVGMRNPLGPADVVLRRAYVELADVNAGIPHAPGIVPPLLDRALPLHQVIPVEHYLPGCPPPADRIRTLIEGLLAGSVEMPPPMFKFG